MDKKLKKFITNNFPQPKTVLDLGCGDGEDIKGLTKLGWRCEGVDIKTGVDLENAFKSKNAPFDLVICNFLLHYILNKTVLLESAYANLKPGGYLFLQDVEKSALSTNMYLTQPEIEKLIKSAGFEVVKNERYKYFDPKPGHKHWHEIIEIKATSK